MQAAFRRALAEWAARRTTTHVASILTIPTGNVTSTELARVVVALGWITPRETQRSFDQ
jgi:hypothetical protein